MILQHAGRKLVILLALRLLITDILCDPVPSDGKICSPAAQTLNRNDQSQRRCPMADVMYTIEAPHGQPTLAQVAQILQVHKSDIDPSFGVVLIEPKRGLYTVRVCEQSSAKPDPKDPRVKGPFASPGIGHLGPLQP
jgi:hypothetical protein